MIALSLLNTDQYDQYSIRATVTSCVMGIWLPNFTLCT